MPILCNNRDARPHVMIYKDTTAFYDVELDGAQARQFESVREDLRPGTVCIVASPAHSGLFEFARWAFSHERTMSDNDDEVLRVFFGRWLDSERLSKSAAAANPTYARFFDVNGHFKRRSVIRA